MSSYNTRTSSSLHELNSYIDLWFEAAQELVKAGIQDDLNVNKIHALLHYTAAFRRFGTSDNYNTETFERRHIDDVKTPYHKSNRRNYFPQIILKLEQDEKVSLFWRRLFRQGLLPVSLARELLRCSLLSDTIEGDERCKDAVR
jgi:hypothetical protein